MSDRWHEGDRILDLPTKKEGTVKEVFQAGAFQHALVITWDDGEESLERDLTRVAVI